MSNWPNQKITIYTDGSCLGNPGVGGWAFVLQVHSGHSLKMQTIKAGQILDTTNNVAELQAVIFALEASPSSVPINFFTDSTYVADGCMKWLDGWKSRGWRKANKKPIANKELWMKLDELLTEKTPKVVWVPAHSDVELNEVVDSRARDAAEHGVKIDMTTYFDNEGNPLASTEISNDGQA